MGYLKLGFQAISSIFLVFIIFAFEPKGNHFSDPAPFEINAESYAVMAPVFKGKEINVLLRVSVHIPFESGSQHFKSIQVKLDANALQSLDSMTVFLTGAEHFSSDNKIANVSTGPVLTMIPFEIDLNPGVHFLWICGKLKKTTSINKKIEVHANSLKNSNGKAIPIKETGGFYVKRIGVALRKSGDDEVHTYRIPGITKTQNGTLISVFDIRYKNSGDLPGNIDVGMSRSKDGGNTWEPMKVIIDMGAPHENNGVGDPSILVDPVTGSIWVAALWSKGNRSIAGSLPGLSSDSTGQLVLVKSDDDGLTWTSPISITSQVKNPIWHLFFNGPGAGIAMKNGNLVFPAQYWDENKKPWSTLIYSKDHGKTWIGNIIGPKINTTESQVVELDSSILMLNMRDNRGGFRSVATTNNMGGNWTEHPTSFVALQDPVCMASILKCQVFSNKKRKDVLFFSNPNSNSGRSNITIKASLDQGRSWPHDLGLLVDENSSYGYSCLVQIDQNNLGLIYEGIGSLYFVSVPIGELLTP